MRSCCISAWKVSAERRIRSSLHQLPARLCTSIPQGRQQQLSSRLLRFNSAEHRRSIREIKPELIIHIREAFAHIPKYYPAPYTLVGRGAKVILWVPVQGAPLPQEFIDACNNHADHVVALTEWGKEQLLFQGVPGNKLDAIPIGYDPS